MDPDLGQSLVESITIGAENGESITFDLPSRDSKGGLSSYRTTIRGPGLSASVLVENHPAGQDPAGFFSQVANRWGSWAGELNWKAVEGEYRLSARANRRGDLFLRVTLRKRFDGWSATVLIPIEAGEVDRFQQAVSNFFRHLT